jgi:hypothetical protein
MSFTAPIRGNSTYDLRRVLNLALNYQPSLISSDRWLRAFTHGWLLANRLSAQSGYPIEVYQDEESILPNGVVANYYPDRVPNVPLYLHGRDAEVGGKPVPANWRINSAAFSPVPNDPTSGLPVRQGTLGRNYVRNPSFFALNTALQRSFPIYERLHLNFRAEAFNILNHPNPDDPDTYLPDSTFGQLYGQTAVIGSSNQLYAMGAARSLQLSLKLEF